MSIGLAGAGTGMDFNAEACPGADGGLAALHAGLGTLDAALDLDDLATASEAMAAYDRSLRAYIDQRGREAPVAGIRELLRLQNQVLLRMDGLRRDVAGELGRMRRAGQASRAYAEAGAE